MSLASIAGSNPTPFGFGGAEQYQSDSDSGLMLLGHRYYDSSIGRFISQDPIQAGTNWYAYCGNNPLTRVDGSGEFWWLLIIAIIYLMQPGPAGEPAPPVQPPGHWEFPVGPNHQVTAQWVPELPVMQCIFFIPGPIGTGFLPTPGAPILGSPRFICPPDGPAVEIPPGSVGRVANSGKGSVWQPPGSVGNENVTRIMDPNWQNPEGYVRVHGPNGVPIDPATGLESPSLHIPLTWGK